MNCTKCGKLILRKGIKIAAIIPDVIYFTAKMLVLVLFGLMTTRLNKRYKFDFGWDSAPDPAGGAYSAPPDSWI